MDLFNKLESTRPSRSHSSYAMREDDNDDDSFDFNQLSIFQNGTQPVQVDPETADIGILGLDSKVLDVMKRWAPDDVVETVDKSTVKVIEVPQAREVADGAAQVAEGATQVVTCTQDVATGEVTQNVATQQLTQELAQDITTQQLTQELAQDITQNVASTQLVPPTQAVPTTQIVSSTQIAPTQAVTSTQPVTTKPATSTQALTTQPISSTQTVTTQPLTQSGPDLSTVLEEEEIPSTQLQADSTADEEVDDDEEVVIPHRHVAIVESDDETPDTPDQIEGYKEMTREEKIEARLKMKERQREEAEAAKAAEKAVEEAAEEAALEAAKEAAQTAQPTSKRTLKPELQQLAEAVKQNDLIRKSTFIVRKNDREKFAPSKMLAAFNDSSSEEEEDDQHLFSTDNQHTPRSSPKEVVEETKHISLPLNTYQEKLKIEANTKKMLSLDSDSDTEPVYDKKHAFEIKRKLIRKNHQPTPKKRTIKDLIHEAAKKQMKKPEQPEVPEMQIPMASQSEIMKMMKEEKEHDARIRKREKEKEERNKMLLDGKLMDDEMDESEYSNEEEEEAQEEDTADKSPVKPAATTTEAPGSPTSPAEISFHLSGGLGDKFSLGDAFEQTLPNKSFEGLEGVQVVKKLQQDSPEVSHVTEVSHDSFDWPQNETTTFNETKMKSLVEEPAPEVSQPFSQKRRLLDSQNFLPDTQDDNATQKMSLESDASDDEEVVEEDQKDRELRMKRLRESRRLEREKRKKRQREMKEKGVTDMFDKEASESEDEWQGIGGADGEYSDEENSEDEKMLDDSTKVKIDQDKIRANLVAHDVQADDEMVKKIYTDLKTGAFRKRRAKDGAYELDLSDDEDEYMREFYEHRRQEYLEQQYMKDGNLRKLAKSESSRAFYETITNDSIRTTSFDFEVDEAKEAPEVEEEENPFKDSNPPAKKRKLTAEQVHSMISFLDEEDDNAGLDDGLAGLGSDDGVEEIKFLKKHSKVSKMRRLVPHGKAAPVEDDTQPADEEGGAGMLARTPSVTASFRHAEKKAVRYSTTTGNEIKEVNVTIGSKPPTRSRGSVTSMTKDSFAKSHYKSSKVARIEETVKAARQHSGLRRIYQHSSGFT